MEVCFGYGRMNTCQTGPTTQTFGWDGLRRLTDIDAGSVHDLAYGYDVFNRRTFKQFEHLLPTIQGDIYAYDGGSRLSDVWYDDANPTAGAPGTGDHFEIDQTMVQARTSTTFNMVTTSYSTGDPLHRTTSIGGVLRTYDDKGNLTDNGAGRRFEYDAWNRMTRVLDGSSSELVRYEFDALSRRHKRFEGTTVTRYVYDGPRLLEEYVNPGTGVFALATRYIYGGGLDELIAIETGGLRYYTYRDALGSIEAITDSAGVVVERYDYDAFGVPTVTDGLGVPTPLGIYGEPTSQYGNDLWFTGARWDPESGNYHMRARQYEPLAGRFVSRDPLGYVDGPNAYSYGFSSPTNWTDPFGLEASGSSGGNNPFLGTAMPASFGPQDAKKGMIPDEQGGWRWPTAEERLASINADYDRQFRIDNPNIYRWEGVGQTAGGVLEGIAAGTLAVAPVPGARIGAAVVGVNAVDDLQAGIRKLAGNESATSLKFYVGYEAAKTLGADERTARIVGTTTEVGGGLAAGGFGAATGRGLVKLGAGCDSAAMSAANLQRLNKQLAAEELLGELMSGGVRTIAGKGSPDAIKDIDRLIESYGGASDEWAKISSSIYTAADGSSFELHGYFNVLTETLYEAKTKFIQ